jgi:hypothetical protein
MMSTEPLHDFGRNFFSDSMLGGLMDVDLGTFVLSGLWFFKE